MPVGDADERGDIIRRQAFEIAQHHDLALHLGQLWQQLLHPRGEALGARCGRRHGRPTARVV